jgi:hypothetical protein
MGWTFDPQDTQAAELNTADSKRLYFKEYRRVQRAAKEAAEKLPVSQNRQVISHIAEGFL